MLYHSDSREPFDPDTLRHLLCLACGAPIVCVGLFLPATDAARGAIVALRRSALPLCREPALAYGLCAEHIQLPVEDIDTLILAAAGKAVFQ